MQLPKFVVFSSIHLLATPAFADSICDPSSTFLTPQLHRSWCPEYYSSSPRAPARRTAHPAQRRPSASAPRETKEGTGEENDRIAVPVSDAAPRKAPRKIAEAPVTDAAERVAPSQDRKAAPAVPSVGNGCVMKELRFSADNLPSLPAANSNWVWGGNATEGGHYVDATYSPNFLRRAKQARERNLEVFAYLEGPCGDTGGKDDGERARCERLHREFNAKFARGTSNSALARWKPFTLRQMQLSKKYEIGHCEIDNLDNNVKVPLIPLLKDIKKRFDSGEIYCRLVLKNLSVSQLKAIKEQIAPNTWDAGFISPFHIFEANNTRQKAGLDSAMLRLKGQGAVTIISTDTDNYGSRFTKDKFLSCGR